MRLPRRKDTTLRFANVLSEAGGLEKCYTIPESEAPTETSVEVTFAGPDCTGYRLPSLAEWQLAASAGHPWRCLSQVQDLEVGADSCGSPPAEKFAVSIGNSGADFEGCVDCNVNLRAPCGHSCCGPQPVASLLPNPYGLYDVIGNLIDITGTSLGMNVTDGPPFPGASATSLASTRREQAPHGDWIDPGYDTSLSTQTPLAITGGEFRQFPEEMCWIRHSALLGRYPTIAALRLVRTVAPKESP